MTTAFANIVQKYQGVASTNVINAVAKASAKTGVDFSFLMEKASTESSFNPAAKAKSSSATGLFQFIENTWLSMVKEHGEKYGLGNLADKITINDDGKACVANCAVKQQILALRKDPEISAIMAGEYTVDNKEYLEDNVKSGPIGATEMYMAHFMGASGATKFLNAHNSNPDAKASALFPQAAQANKNVFYDKSGKSRTLDEVYQRFANKFQDGSAAKFQSGTTPPEAASVSPTEDFADIGSALASAAASPLDPLKVAAQTPPSFKASDIIWSDDPRYTQLDQNARTRSFGSHSNSTHTGFSRLSSSAMLTLLDMQHAHSSDDKRNT